MWLCHCPFGLGESVSYLLGVLMRYLLFLLLLLLLPSTQAKGWKSFIVTWRSAVAVTENEPWPTAIHEAVLLEDKDGTVFFGEAKWGRVEEKTTWRLDEKVACTSGNEDLTCTREGQVFFSWPYITKVRQAVLCVVSPLYSGGAVRTEAVLVCSGERYRADFSEAYINGWRQGDGKWSLLRLENGDSWLVEEETAHVKIAVLIEL